MSLQYSDALANFLVGNGSLKDALDGGRIEIYTGAQPANANATKTGTLLVTITKASGALTQEVDSVGSIRYAGASGSIDTLTVEGHEVMGSSTPFNTSLAQTVADVAYKCNVNPANKLFRMTTDGIDKVIITAVGGLGALPNGWVVASTATTMTTGTIVNMGSVTAGVANVNGLVFGVPASQVLGKRTGDVWSGVAVADGVAGWFRFYQSEADAGALDSSAVFRRLDGNIATSGATMNMSNTTIVNLATQTITAVALTQPEA